MPIIIPTAGQGITLATAISEVKERGFQYLSDDRVTFALNNAKNAFEDSYAWPWLETTATGVAPLALSDVKQILSVRDTTNHRELSGLDGRDVVSLDPDVSTAGTPSSWWLSGNTLNLWPTSATAQLSVRYIAYSSELSASTDIVGIPSRHAAIWVDLAVLELAKDDDNWQTVQQLQADTQRRIQLLIESYAARDLQNPVVQQIVYGSEDW